MPKITIARDESSPKGGFSQAQLDAFRREVATILSQHEQITGVMKKHGVNVLRTTVAQDGGAQYKSVVETPPLQRVSPAKVAKALREKYKDPQEMISRLGMDDILQVKKKIPRVKRN